MESVDLSQVILNFEVKDEPADEFGNILLPVDLVEADSVSCVFPNDSSNSYDSERLHNNLSIGDGDGSEKIESESSLCKNLCTEVCSDINPYRCPDCGLCFSRRSDLIFHCVCRHGYCEATSKRHQKRQSQRTTSYAENQTQKQNLCKVRKVTVEKVSCRILRSASNKNVCTICGQQFRQVAYLKQHMAIHTGDRRYQCLTCDKRFSRSNHLKKHLLAHSSGHLVTGKADNDGRQNACMFCGHVFRLSNDLKRHVMVHTGEKPYSCTSCGKRFSRAAHVRDHMRTHTGDKPHKCMICGKEYAQKTGLNQHLRMHDHTCDTAHRCMICGKEYAHKSGLNHHLRVHDQIHDTDKSNDYVRCTECNMVLRSASVKYHMMIHNGEKPYICMECSKAFRAARTLKVHMRAVHTGERPCGCAFCPRHFTDRAGLLRHERTHTGEKPYQCDLCGATFTVSTQLKKHSLRHSPNNSTNLSTPRSGCPICGKDYANVKEHMKIHGCRASYQCNVCLRGFNVARYLKKHMMTHTGEKPYSCDLCDKRFTQAGQLKRHVLTHTGEKPFSCPHCPKKFSRVEILRRHVTCHTSENGFVCFHCGKQFTSLHEFKNDLLQHSLDGVHCRQCGDCGRTFKNQDALRRHSHLHDGLKPHKCKMCEKSFASLFSLRRHALTHGTVKPYECIHCHKRFTQSGTMTLHIVKQHMHKLTVETGTCYADGDPQSLLSSVDQSHHAENLRFEDIIASALSADSSFDGMFYCWLACSANHNVSETGRDFVLFAPDI